MKQVDERIGQTIEDAAAALGHHLHEYNHDKEVAACNPQVAVRVALLAVLGAAFEGVSLHGKDGSRYERVHARIRALA